MATKAQSRKGAALQKKINAEDRLRARKVPEGMMGSAWGYNRPRRPGILQRIGSAWKAARKAQQIRKNPPPRLEGAVDITDINPEVPKRRRTI